MDSRSPIQRWWRAGRARWRRVVDDAGHRDDLLALGAWLVGGSLVGGLVGVVVLAVVPVELPRSAVVGLGIAFGGGLGVVSNTTLTSSDGPAEGTAVTVEDDDEPPSPQPADLFDEHPDPVLYVADEGYGPVVRAANVAYEDTFAPSAETLIGTPLSEATMIVDRSAEVVGAVEESRPLDAVVTCETPDGDRRFRVRIAGDERTCYLVYTPLRDE